VKLSRASICAPKKIWAKKSEKVKHTTTPLKKKRRKKVREKSDVYFLSLSLSFLFRECNARARDCSGLSLLLFYFLLSSSERRKERIKRVFLKWKIKKYCGARDVVHSQRCPFVHQKSLKHREKRPFCSEKIFPEILRGQCSPHYIRLRVQNPFDSHPHKESASTDTQTDRQISSRNFRSGTLFFLCKTSEL